MKRIDPISSIQTPSLKKPSILVRSPTSVFGSLRDGSSDVHEFLEFVRSHEKACVSLCEHANRSGYTNRNRAILLDWMTEFCKEHYLHRPTLHLAANLLDRFMSSDNGASLNRSDLQPIGLAALILSIKNTVHYFFRIDCSLHVGGKSCEYSSYFIRSWSSWFSSTQSVGLRTSYPLLF